MIGHVNEDRLWLDLRCLEERDAQSLRRQLPLAVAVAGGLVNAGQESRAHRNPTLPLNDDGAIAPRALTRYLRQYDA